MENNNTVIWVFTGTALFTRCGTMHTFQTSQIYGHRIKFTLSSGTTQTFQTSYMYGHRIESHGGNASDRNTILRTRVGQTDLRMRNQTSRWTRLAHASGQIRRFLDHSGHDSVRLIYRWETRSHSGLTSLRDLINFTAVAPPTEKFHGGHNLAQWTQFVSFILNLTRARRE